jgi:hypothetical protein
VADIAEGMIPGGPRDTPVSDRPDNLLLVYLRRIDERLARLEGEFHARMGALEARFSALEARFSSVETAVSAQA